MGHSNFIYTEAMFCIVIYPPLLFSVVSVLRSPVPLEVNSITTPTPVCDLLIAVLSLPADCDSPILQMMDILASRGRLLEGAPMLNDYLPATKKHSERVLES